MEKRNIYIFVAVAIVAVLVLGLGNLTGTSTYDAPEGCSDSDVSLEYDDGINYYTTGIVKYANKEYSYTDYCFSRGTGPEKYVNEYYCLADNIESKDYNCAKEDMSCVEGACVA